jgi:hypothetical protein
MGQEAVQLGMVPINCPAIRAWQDRKLEMRERFHGNPCEIAESDQRIDGKIEQIQAAAERIGCTLLAKELPEISASIPQIGTDEWNAFVSECPAYVALKESGDNITNGS